MFNQNRLMNWSFLAIISSLFLLPLFFIPFSSVSIIKLKAIIFLLGTVLSLVFYIFSGNFSLRNIKTDFLSGLLILSLGAIVSSLFWGRGNIMDTYFFGQSGFDITSVSFISSLFIFVSMVFIHSREVNKRKVFLKTIGYSFCVLSIYTFLMLIIGKITGSQYLAINIPSNIFGGINDLAYFIVIGIMITTYALFTNKQENNKSLNVFFLSSISVGLILLMIINLTPSWIFLSIFFVIIFFAPNNLEKETENTTISNTNKRLILSIFLFVSVFFMINSIVPRLGGSSKLVTFLPKYFNVQFIEIKPSLKESFRIFGKEFIKGNTLVGSGPNHYQNSFLNYKSSQLNKTDLWNVGINFGYNLYFTLITSLGILGILGIFVLVFALIKNLVFLIKKNNRDLDNVMIISLFSISLFITLINNPGFVLLAVVFAVFAVSYFYEGKTILEYLSFLNTKIAKNILLVLKHISIFAVLVVVMYSIPRVSEKIIGEFYMLKSIKSYNPNQDGKTTDIVAFDGSLKKTLSYDMNDTYLRNVSAVYREEAVKLAYSDEEKLKGMSKEELEELKKKFFGLVGASVNQSTAAILYDNRNYQNYISLGLLQESILPFMRSEKKDDPTFNGIYEAAKSQYNAALVLNPKSLEIKYLLARVDAVYGKKEESIAQLETIIQEKPDYYDALVLLQYLKKNDKAVSVPIEQKIEQETLPEENNDTKSNSKNKDR